mmetsp:Transcript_31720/g.54090  ORF Transcript_31720/g.54090 Transcript_31720/m.54090 type:complete len:97 (-) Transcript_31720:1549-1839(-)
MFWHIPPIIPIVYANDINLFKKDGKHSPCMSSKEASHNNPPPSTMIPIFLPSSLSLSTSPLSLHWKPPYSKSSLHIPQEITKGRHTHTSSSSPSLT